MSEGRTIKSLKKTAKRYEYCNLTADNLPVLLGPLATTLDRLEVQLNEIASFIIPDDYLNDKICDIKPDEVPDMNKVRQALLRGAEKMDEQLRKRLSGKENLSEKGTGQEAAAKE